MSSRKTTGRPTKDLASQRREVSWHEGALAVPLRKGPERARILY